MIREREGRELTLLEVLHFIFSSFWVFVGTAFLLWLFVLGVASIRLVEHNHYHTKGEREDERSEKDSE